VESEAMRMMEDELAKKDREVFWLKPFRIAVTYIGSKPRWITLWIGRKRRAYFRPPSDPKNRYHAASAADVNDIEVLNVPNSPFFFITATNDAQMHLAYFPKIRARLLTRSR
jgi:hypothetical protein